jgi:hypothetical protein
MLISNLKLLLRFNTSALYEEVSNTNLVALGDNTFPQILDGGGYIMANNQYLIGEGSGYTGYSTEISNAMTLGFWLYPVSPGMATDTGTGDAVSISMPVMDFNDIGSNNNSIIKLTENTTVNGENNLTVSLNGGTYYASSEDYEPSLWHHFWIVYDGSIPLISIYVDGKQHVLQGEVGDPAPVSLSGLLLDLYINHNLDGYAYNVAKNYGYITDIFMLNIADTSETNMQRVINDGISYLIDDNYTNTHIEKSSIYLNDPDTIIVNSFIDDMSYVYLGRNDGKILRGSPLFWETRRTFADNKELELLGLLSTDITSTGFLDLKNKNIRL